ASISALQATPSDGFVEQDLEMNAEQLGTENLLQSQTPSWSIEILYGPSVSYRTFDSELNPELVSHKNSNDRSMLSANMSLMIRKYIDENWSVAAGVQTFNCGEKYSYTVNSATHNFDNAYNYISIPLEADYRIFQKAGISLDVGIGAQYNYLREGTSSWVDLDSSQPVTHNNKGEGSPFSESTIGFNSDVTARYILSPLLDLIVQPRAAVFTKSLYKEETGLDQRPYALSMMVGLSADF
ncbi:MAG: PorT family protein, partial [Flavobacteriales bacterium]|nr:PorT family protein [Flavobacteriales bacterium]